MQKAVILIFCASLLWSCTSVRVTHFDNVERPPTSAVDIYSTFSSVKREYKEIALITADDEWYWYGQSEVSLIKHLKKKAMRIGADAIVLQQGEKQASGFGYFSSSPIYFEGTRVAKVVAIIYLSKGESK